MPRPQPESATVQVSFRLDADLLAQLDQMAAASKTTRTNLIRLAVVDLIGFDEVYQGDLERTRPVPVPPGLDF